MKRTFTVGLRSIVGFVLLVGCVVKGWAFPVSYEWEDIDYPGALGTYPSDINERNEVVGTYSDLAYARYGFVYYYDGEASIDDFTDVTITKPDGEPYFYTNLYGNNNSRLVTGWYRDRGSSSQMAMVYDYQNGQIMAEFPTNWMEFLTFLDVNDDGWLVGSKDVNGVNVGVIRNLNTGKEYVIDFRDEGRSVYFSSINDRGLIVGKQKSSDKFQGILFDFYSYRSGGELVFQTYDDVVPSSNGYVFLDVNDRGWILGQYEDAQGKDHPFLLDANSGSFSDLLQDYPDLLPNDRHILDLQVNGINDEGYIVGWQMEREPTGGVEYRGFLLSPQGSGAQTVVPEPSSFGLLIFGILLGSGLKRRDAWSLSNPKD